jgi:maleylpyruvate isomerase
VRPQLEIDGAVAAHAELLRRVQRLTPAQVRRPSLLPGWTVGHVLTHLARNADSHTGMFLAAQGGGVADQYPGGMAQRTADIEAGATRAPASLTADLASSIAALEAAWDTTSTGTWAHGRGRTGNAGERPLADLVFRRWRETEVHHADLGLSFGWTDWSESYVDEELDRTISGVAPRLPPDVALRLEAEGMIGAWVVEPVPAARVTVRAPKHELLAWLLGRSDRPDWPPLAPWG